MATPDTLTTLPTVTPLDRLMAPLVSMPRTSWLARALLTICTVRLPLLKLGVSLSVTVTCAPASSLTGAPFSV